MTKNLSPFIPEKYRQSVKKSELKDPEQTPRSQMHSNKRLPLIIGPSVDPNFSYIMKNFKDRAHCLALEHLGTQWMPFIENSALRFLTENGEPIHFSGIYFRSAELTHDYAFRGLYEHMFRMMDFQKFRTLGSRKYCYRNSSKPLQMKMSILGANTMVGIPKTYIVKKKGLQFSELKQKFPSGIVKGISNLRCEVTDSESYKNFDYKALETFPAMFQERLNIKREIRVHVINSKVFPLEIKHNGAVDYRYSDKGSFHELCHLPGEVQNFCLKTQILENNPLVGIDIVECDDGYKCFEINPNPGWGAFQYSKGTKDAIAKEILLYLEGSLT